MESLVEKLSLLSELIAFSIVDGELHEKEYQFILLIATELKIDKKTLDDLFQQEMKPLPIKSELDRIQQFYRLALLMHVDGVLHPNQIISLNELGIKMGLNPASTKRVLYLMEKQKSCLLDPETLFNLFEPQHN